MPRANGKQSRKSYSIEHKLTVVAHAEKIGNRAAAREFEVDESMVRYWRKKRLNGENTAA